MVGGFLANKGKRKKNVHLDFFTPKMGMVNFVAKVAETRNGF